MGRQDLLGFNIAEIHKKFVTCKRCIFYEMNLCLKLWNLRYYFIIHYKRHILRGTAIHTISCMIDMEGLKWVDSRDCGWVIKHLVIPRYHARYGSSFGIGPICGVPITSWSCQWPHDTIYGACRVDKWGFGMTMPGYAVQHLACITWLWHVLTKSELSHNLILAMPFDHFRVDQRSDGQPQIALLIEDSASPKILR